MVFGFTNLTRRSTRNGSSARQSAAAIQSRIRKQASRKLLFEGLEDRRVMAGFTAGSIQGQDGWTGGNIAISSSVFQTVDQTGFNAHTGTGSWQISNNTTNGNANGAFNGWPFTPGLAVSAGQPSSGALADRFSATFYFKAGSSVADGSNMEVDLGTVSGDDRNTFMAITNRADVDGGFQIRMSEPDGVTGDFLNTQIVSTGLNRTVWHRIDITAVFTDGAGNDTFQVSLDGSLLLNPNAVSPNFNTPNFGTFEGYRNGISSPYALSNRLFFRSGAVPSAYGAFADNASQGIFVDDLSYRAYNSSNPIAPLASYSAAFETQPTNTYVDQAADFSITTDNGASGLDAGDIVTWNGPSSVAGLVFGTDAFTTVQGGVTGVAAGGNVYVASGTFVEDVSIAKTLHLLGAGPGNSIISGAIGGSGSTVQIAASNVEVAGFTITREGNNPGQWNDPGLNLGGITIQGQAFTAALIHDNLITGNRTGIDINNSNGHTIRNNVISDNRTGLLFRNQTDNLQVSENAITNNFTVGILFLDGSGGSNSPVQSAIGSVFTNNNLSGNWYGQIVDRQTGGSLPAPGTNLKDFSGNWFGTATPAFSTANSAEPGYAAQIPVAFGGGAVAPGGQPDILGPALANFDVTPWLNSGVDTNPIAYGFQGDFSSLTVTTQGAQVGSIGRITEGYNALTSIGTLAVRAGTYTEDVNLGLSGDKAVTLALGASPGQVVVNGNVTLTSNDTLPIEINGTNPANAFDNLIVNGTVALGNATLTLSGPYVLNPADSFVIVSNDGSDPVSGIFGSLPEGSLVTLAGQQLFISYQGGDGNDVVLESSPTVVGTAGADTLVFTPTAGGYSYSLNGGPTVNVTGNPAFTFNGLGGDDLMTVLLNNFALPTNGVFFNGGSQDTPGANPNYGDVLKIVGSGTQTATYAPDGVLNPLLDNDGTVTIAGQGVIHFTQLEPVDMSALAVVNVNFANADDAITLASGFDAATGLIPALVVSGTSGLVPFEAVHLWNNGLVNIDTVAGGTDGNDTVAITGGNNGHANANVTISTGSGTDSVTVSGTLVVSGNLAISSQAIAFTTGALSAANASLNAGLGSISDANATTDITATGTLALFASSGIGVGNPIETATPQLEATGGSGGIALTNSGDLFVGGVTGSIAGLQATSGNINVSTTGTLIIAEAVNTLGGNVTLSTVDGVGLQNLIVGSSINATGSVLLNAGDDLTLNAPITAGTTVTGNVDAGNADVGTGGVFTLAGSVGVPVAITAPGGTFLNGNTDDDTFNVYAQSTTTFNIDGDLPVGTPTGDVLAMNVTGTGASLTVGGTSPYAGAGSGTWAFGGGLQSIRFKSIEDSQIIGGYHLTYDFANSAPATTNLFVMRDATTSKLQLRDGSNAGPILFQANLAATPASSGVLSLKVLGTPASETVTVDDINTLPVFAVAVPATPDNSLLAGQAGLLFQGAGGVNQLNFALTGAGVSQTYAIGNGSGIGSSGEVLTTAGAGSLTSYFTGLGPTGSVNRTGGNANPGSLTILGDNLANTIQVSGVGAATNVNPVSYTPFNYTASGGLHSFSGLSLFGLDGDDTLNLQGFGSAVANDPVILLDGGNNNDTLQVGSTSGNLGLITMLGQAGNDTFRLASDGLVPSGANRSDLINGKVVVDGGPAAGNDQLFVVALANSAALTNVQITGTTIDNVMPASSMDVTFSNVNLLDVTGTNLADTITTTLTAPSVNNDLAIVNVHGGDGTDQFYLNVPATPTNTPAGLTNINLYGDAGNDTFGDAANKIVPAYSLATGANIFIDGGTPDVPLFNPLSKNSIDGDKAGDRLYLDMSSTTGPVIVDTVTGIADSASHRRLVYNGIEDIDLYDTGALTNVHQGALYMRATDSSDYIVLMGLSGGKVRIRANNGYFGDYAPTTKLVIYARGGNDYIATSAMPANLPLELYGNEGDDSITGSAANDLIVGGEGLDRISGGAGGADEIWGDVFNPVVAGLPNLDVMVTPLDPAAIAWRATQVDRSIFNSQGGAASNPSTDGNDILTTAPGNGADRIYGQGGNDIVTASAQDDTLYGGDGIDNLNGANGNDRLYGGAGNDNLAGEGGDDFLYGGDGNDTLNGGLGNDVLVGGLGQDILRGDQNRDLLVGGLVSFAGTNSGNADSKAYGDVSDLAMLELLNNWSAAVAPSIPFAGLTVTNDNERDSLTGGAGADDFYNDSADLLIDYLVGQGDRKTL